MTAFNLIQFDPGGLDNFNLVPPTALTLTTGSSVNGNATPFEAGTLGVANGAGSSGDVTW
jgi:hypothetical protein